MDARRAHRGDSRTGVAGSGQRRHVRQPAGVVLSGRWPADRLQPASYPAPGVDLPIFYGDLDTERHLNNAVFARFFEHARYTAHTLVGLPPLMSDGEGRILVARLAIDYITEAHFGTPLHIRTRVASFGRSSLIEEQAAWQNGTCVAIAEVVIAYRHGAEAAEIPSSVRGVLEALAVPGIDSKSSRS